MRRSTSRTRSPSASRAVSQTLDEREIARWVDRIEAGNLYVNRPVTGALVGRQPFGGWKASSVGPGAKAGGAQLRAAARALAAGRPARLAAMSRWRRRCAALLDRCVAALDDDGARALVRASAASYTHAWREHFSREHDPAGILGERNVFRYRPCRRVIARGSRSASLCQVILAASVAGTSLTVSLRPDSESWPWLMEHPGAEVVVEAEAGFVERLAHPDDADRVRTWEPTSTGARAAANGTGVTVIDAPVLANGRLELRWYLREQTVSRVLHRYGSVVESPLPVSG